MKLFELDEYEDLPIGPGAAAISGSEWARFQTRWQTMTAKKLSACFEFTGSTIRPKNWVGVVATDTIVLEVSPRGAKRLDSTGRERLSSNIDQMLRIAISGPSIRLADAFLHGAGSRLDSAVESMCDRVLLARRRRVLRKYTARIEQTSAFRGRLLFPAEALNRIRRPGAFTCHWVEPNEDTADNLFLKWAMFALRASVGAAVRRRLDECLAEFDRVTNVDGMHAYKRIRFDRLPPEYVDAIRIAKSLVDGEIPDLFAGALSSRSELVFMPGIFERFVRRIAADAAARTGWMVTEKSGLPLATWESGPFAGAHCFRLIPDVEVRAPGVKASMLLLDAKWKPLRPTSHVLGVDEKDVYQMMTYLHRYNCSRGVLVYPSLTAASEDAPAVTLETRGRQPAWITIVRMPLLWEGVSDAVDTLADVLDGVAAVPIAAVS